MNINVKAIGISAVIGTIAMFAWQGFSQMALPWHRATAHAATGPMMGGQAGVDFLVVLALCLVVPLLIDQSTLAVGKAFALVGFAMSLFQSLSMVIWNGFTIGWAGVQITDQTITFCLTGLVVGALVRRFGPDKGVAVPDGQGYRTSGGRKTVAR